MKEPSFHARESLREVINGATIRAIANITDMGEVLVARVKNVLGGDPINTEGDLDAMIHYEDIMQGGFGGLARLYFPLNVLFGTPNEEEQADIQASSCMVIRGRNAGSPGGPYMLWGDAKGIPSWIREKIGLWTKKVLRIESTDNDVEIQPGSGKKIKLGDGATKGVARVDDPIQCPVNVSVSLSGGGTSTVILSWTPYNGSLQTLQFSFTGVASLNGQPVATTATNFGGSITGGSTKTIIE